MPITTQVTFSLFDALNNPVVGATLAFKPYVPEQQYLATIDGEILSGSPIEAVTGSGGTGSVTLIASSQFQSQTGPVPYVVTISMPNGDTRILQNFVLDDIMLITVPDSGPVTLASLILAVGGSGGAPQGYVQSVNGFTGVVVLDTDDIPEGVTNLYYSNGLVAVYISTIAGHPNGLATLDGTGKVPVSELPSFPSTYSYVTINASMSPYTMPPNIDLVFVDTSSGPVTVLLSPSSFLRPITFKDYKQSFRTHNLILNPQGGTVDGVSGNVQVIGTDTSIELMSDGTNYFIL